MMRDQNKRSSLDAPRIQLREKIHSQHVQVAQSRRSHDAEVARDDVSGAKLGDLPGPSWRRAVGGPKNDWGESRTGVDPGVADRPLGEGRDGRAAIDQHPSLLAVDRCDDPEMAIRR